MQRASRPSLRNQTLARAVRRGVTVMMGWDSPVLAATRGASMSGGRGMDGGLPHLMR